MKYAYWFVVFLKALCGVLPYHVSAKPMGWLGALATGIRIELEMTGAGQDVRRLDGMSDEVNKDILVSQAKRAEKV